LTNGTRLLTPQATACFPGTAEIAVYTGAMS
jgi:hypothetical protein